MKATVSVEFEDSFFSREIEYSNKEELDLEMKKFQDDPERHAFMLAAGEIKQ